MMTQNSELAKVKARIRALANKTVDRGCSEHEAMQAMSMVGKLLEQYSLTMSEIDVREAVCKTIKVETTASRTGIDNCIVALASLFDAKIWRSTSWDTSNPNKWVKRGYYCFFGTEDDLEMIQYLYHVIEQAFETETAIFKTTAVYKNSAKKKSATTSFGHGMGTRLSYRLEDLKKQVAKDLAEAETRIQEEQAAWDVVREPGQAPRSTGTALVALKGQLVKEEWKKQGIKLRTAYSTRTVRSGDSYRQGYAAGDRVNLSRPIGGSKTSGYLS